ncbi:MAG: ribonuclease E/G [Clostridia bacterium]|nr:ribonuclease E/G [Clostridia bacterium]
MQELIIEEGKLFIKLIVLEDNKIVEFYQFDKNNMPKIGNIYRAKVKDINRNSGAIFVYYDDNKVGYIDRTDKDVRVNDEIVVMLKKEATETKDAKMTTDISIAGKYIVLFSNSDIHSSSKKNSIDSNLTKMIEEELQNKYGYVVRTEASNVEPEIVFDELKQLINKWHSMEENYNSFLYNANEINEVILREFCKKSLSKIYINSEEIYEEIKSKIDIEIDFEPDADFIEKFGMIGQLEDKEKRKIWLKSSGFINIDFTEALTAIDVNSGKYLGNNGADKEEFCSKVNEEAALEVMRQLRLKNLGGIIVVDFINMKSPENKAKIIDLMRQEALKDRSKVEIYGFTNLGLVEIARKKV